MSARAKKTAQQIVGLGTFQMAGPAQGMRQGGYTAVHLVPPPFTNPAATFLVEHWVTDSGPAHWVAITAWMSKQNLCAFMSFSQAGVTPPNLRVWQSFGGSQQQILGVNKPAGWLGQLCKPAWGLPGENK